MADDVHGFIARYLPACHRTACRAFRWEQDMIERVLIDMPHTWTADCITLAHVYMGEQWEVRVWRDNDHAFSADFVQVPYHACLRPAVMCLPRAAST